MKIIYLRSLPYNNSKIYQQVYEGVKKRANSYVYVDGDRIKKICNCNCQSINNLTVINADNSSPHQYQVFLIEPDDQIIIKTKIQMLEKQREQFKQQITLYQKHVEKIEKKIKKYMI